MKIREARVEDAKAACVVLRRSITELCHKDHGNDKVFLSKWLANKTPENVAEWIADSDSYTFVAEESGVIVGVGAMKNSGQITLNYVSPDSRFTAGDEPEIRAANMYAPNEIRELLGKWVLLII
jgi:hypothetical protein